MKPFTQEGDAHWWSRGIKTLMLANMTRPIAYLVCVFCVSTVLVSGVTRAEERFEFTSYQMVDDLFDRTGYTPEAWQAGIREVPRLYLSNVPQRWRDNTADEVTVKAKKRIFFRLAGPLAMRANELILEDRERLASMISDTARDTTWLIQLAIQYRVIKNAKSDLSPAELAELVKRVDIIPTSMALAQGAEESGWGTSRFADQGNALFGQWTWGEGIKPEEQRSGRGDYRIAAFETPLQSFVAYMRNLNSHPAYAGLRDERAQLRASDSKVTGRALVHTLTAYSERGEEYVESLRAIMRVNKLYDVDEAYFSTDEPIFLVPTGSGAD